MSSLHAIKNTEERTVRETRQSRANNFATNVSSSEAVTSTAESNGSDTEDSDSLLTTVAHNIRPVKCAFCREGHILQKCGKLMGRPVEEKRKFVLDNKLCFACLRKGHASRDCRNRATCALCKKRHPTPLHEDRPVSNASSQANLPAEENTVSLSCSLSGEAGSSTSMIVPVWLSSPNTESEILVYALLDTQSSHTFVDREVCERLQIEREPVRLKLSTMMGLCCKE